MKRLLITSFEPFGGDTLNASAEAAGLVPEVIGGWSLVKRELPVVFGLAGERCLALVEALAPDAVLLLGQAAGRSAVTPELAARNYRWARIPDNAGRSPRGEAVVPGGEDALFATLPVGVMTAAIRGVGLPAALSCAAGYYVCNDLYYTVLHRLRGTPIRAGFVHVPGSATLPAAEAARAVAAAIGALDEVSGRRL